MGYYVVSPDGQRYGPADIATLNTWIAEGRLIGSTQLIDASTGATVLAQHVPGLMFGSSTQTVLPGSGTPLGGYTTQNDPQQQIYTSPYQQSNYTRAGYTPLGYGQSQGRPSSNITISYVLSAVSLVAVCCCPVIGIITSLAAVAIAGADRTNHPQRTWAMVAGVVTLVINIGLLIAGVSLQHMMPSGGG